MYCYAATVFVSAFLLFQVQPMVARFVLPWFGGTSLVWTTCMLFFQVVLVLGYAYSHLVTRKLTPRHQWILHSIILGLALASLPIRPSGFWQPDDGYMATWRVLALLTVCVGLPFFLVSTTGPLIQVWQSVTHPNRSPFRLFALSNLASLLALVSYPLLYERYLSLDAQSWNWSAGFGLFAGLVFFAGYRFVATTAGMPDRIPRGGSTHLPDPSQSAFSASETIPAIQLAMWLVLPMLASIILLASTNLMTQEVGSIPFLWVLPLSLYLLSFIICFDHQRWYVRMIFFPLFFGSVLFSAVVLELGVEAPIAIQVAGYSLVCFGAAMCCHGELARLKPAPRHLTLFYLLIAIGGALGGVFVAIIAPRLLVNYYEFPVSVLLAVLLTLFAYGYQVRYQELQTNKDAVRLANFAFILFVGVLTALFAGMSCFRMYSDDRQEFVLLQTRNEYGTLTVKDYPSNRKLNNGQIEHGVQYKDRYWSTRPTTYYCPSSGLGRAIEYLRSSSRPDTGLSFGAIGLGVGTICAWCEPGDYLCYYEINPRVEEISRTYFTYLDDCQADVVIRLGDARLQLQRELASGDARKYDVLIADAFSSDSIPIHLLTLEAFQIYQQRLSENGILAVHTSNRFLQLANVVRTLAGHLGFQCVYVDDDPDESVYNSSSWVLVTRDSQFVIEMESAGYTSRWPDARLSAFWTDDFSSIMPLVKWHSGRDWWNEFLHQMKWMTGKNGSETQ